MRHLLFAAEPQLVKNVKMCPSYVFTRVLRTHESKGDAAEMIDHYKLDCPKIQ